MITIFTKQGEKLYIPSKSIGNFCLQSESDALYLKITYPNGKYLWDGYIVQNLEEEDIVSALVNDGIVLGLNEARKEY